MKTLLLVKELYLDGFRHISHYLVKNYFKIFAWFSFTMLAVAIYAFFFRLWTGFYF